MIEAFRYDDHITRLDRYSDPLIVFITHIEIAAAIHTEPDFLIIVNVFPVEVLNLLLIIGQFVRANADLIVVSVASVRPYLGQKWILYMRKIYTSFHQVTILW